MAGARKKILFATMPFDGHFNPLTGLAKHLQEAGHEVRWYAGPSYAARLEKLGIPRLPFVKAREVTGDNIAALFPERARLAGPKLMAFDMKHIFVENVEAHFRDIAAARDGFAFDVFFCDAALAACVLVAEKLKLPVFVVGVSPLLLTSRDAPPNFFGLKPARTSFGKLLQRIPRALVDASMKDGIGSLRALFAKEGLPPSGARFFDLPVAHARRFFQSGVPGFEYPRGDLPANVEFVGPLLPHRSAIARGFPHADRLREFSSLIVVSQGTVDNKDPEKLIVPALEALRGSPHLVIATTGGCRTDELRARFPERNLIVEDFVDFNAAFEHARLFICNGGYGSILMALARGVPVLSAGVREGKNDINARIDWFGLGIDLGGERPSSRKIARGVARVLGEPCFGERVAKLRSEIAGYRPFEIIDRRLDELQS